MKLSRLIISADVISGLIKNVDTRLERLDRVMTSIAYSVGGFQVAGKELQTSTTIRNAAIILKVKKVTTFENAIEKFNKLDGISQKSRKIKKQIRNASTMVGKAKTNIQKASKTLNSRNRQLEAASGAMRTAKYNLGVNKLNSLVGTYNAVTIPALFVAEGTAKDTINGIKSVVVGAH